MMTRRRIRPDAAIPIPARWMPRRPLFHAPTPGLQPVPEGAWRSLFDGKTLNGWVVEDKDKTGAWVVENGAIHVTGKGGGYLRSEEQFENFVLAYEYNLDKETNSGVFVRWSDLKDPVHTSIEVQLFDSAGRTKLDKHDNGALYDLVAPTANPTKPAGEWNWMLISCNGPMISVLSNGVKVAETDLSQYTEPRKSPDGTPNKFKYALAKLPHKGYLGLQNHGFGLWFRNLLILPL
jgi:hypothetical protein